MLLKYTTVRYATAQKWTGTSAIQPCRSLTPPTVCTITSGTVRRSRDLLLMSSSVDVTLWFDRGELTDRK